MIYTGIGSRGTPKDILQEMEYIGEYLAIKNYILRSGNARGADTAFANGCDKVSGMSEIYLPFKNFGVNKRNTILVTDEKILKYAFDIAKSVKPKDYIWSSKNKPYHTRNVFQILGYHLTKPTDFVICWTSTGAESHKECIERKEISGTSLAISVASMFEIPVINMFNSDWEKRFLKIIDEYL